MKKIGQNIAIALIIGVPISILQMLVIQGFPLKFTDEIWGEILYAGIYVLVFRFLVDWQIRTIGEINKTQKVPNQKVLNSFLIVQCISLTFFFLWGIILTIVLIPDQPIKLKDLAELRFILVYYFFINTILFVIELGGRIYLLYNQEKEAKYQAEKSFMKAQLQMLRQQLNPHFLFNNLNIIASTIKSNPELAYNFTKNMASFYRKVLESENAGWITLEEELKTIRHYLHLLSVRFEDKLIFEINIEKAMAQKHKIPDFILQPIVENIIKHNECSRKNPLHIIIELKSEQVLVVRNKYQPKNAQEDSLGIGWFNIESRYKYLEATTPKKYILDDWFWVEIALV